ncbi:MAG: nucleotidyltransferase domain-containing protein [Candidatus Sulfobium sp.]|jgi:predicted nucleotidyltransferase
MIKFGKKISGADALFRSLVERLSLRSMMKVIYLFGSRAADRADELSDIDIALLVEGGRMPLDVELDLLGEITSILQTDEVSLVVLNNAPLTVAYGVIKEARVLYSSNERERLDFEELITRKYFDFKHYLDIYDREFISIVGR